MGLDSKLIRFRKKIRLNSSKITTTIINEHTANLCIFCGETENLTREHVIPQWIYNHCTKRTFITTTNGSSQTYNKTTVPACEDCNTKILGDLERSLKHEFERIDVRKNEFTTKTMEHIILWLETLEYKFHVLDLRRTLNRVEGAAYIPYIGKMPISMFQAPLDTSPAKVFSNLRSSLKVLSIKSKANRLNSLCILYTKNTSFHFFHSTNNYIFIELAEFNVAFFYFFKETFTNQQDAQAAAKKIVEKEYSSSTRQQQTS